MQERLLNFFLNAKKFNEVLLYAQKILQFFSSCLLEHYEKFFMCASFSIIFFRRRQVLSWFFEKHMQKFFLFFCMHMRKMQTFIVKNESDYCLENFDMDDFECYSLSYYIVFVKFLINIHAFKTDFLMIRTRTGKLISIDY